jgi:helicase MOV-10
MLPNPQVPLIFHGIQGEHEREGNSPSWFNSHEIKVVLNYVAALVGFRGITPASIGIVTPYRKQVEKLRIGLKSKSAHYNEVTVGTCEQFQGQERRIIIISTVRSSTEYDDQDKYFNLGFLANPKRFNVAVTRAQALLIVVGNPRVLKSDPSWSRFLQHCSKTESCRGVNVVEDSINNIIDQLTELTIVDEDVEISEEDDIGIEGTADRTALTRSSQCTVT